MLKLPNLPFRGTEARYVLIGILAIIVCVLFYFLGFLFIQTIALVAYVSIFPAILIWERKKRERAPNDPKHLSEDERWSTTKMKMEKIERRMGNESDPAKMGALLQEKRYLESELRQLEWKIRESEMTEMYNASKGNMKKIDTPGSVIATMAALDAKFKKLDAIRNQLSKILIDVEEIIKNEQQASREISLMRIANDLKAQFNALKRNNVKSSPTNGNSDISSALLSDHWACWVAVTSLAKGFPIDKNLIKYASSDFKLEFSKFLKSLDLNNLQVPERELFQGQV